MLKNMKKRVEEREINKKNMEEMKEEIEKRRQEEITAVQHYCYLTNKTK